MLLQIDRRMLDFLSGLDTGPLARCLTAQLIQS